jgi:hypothetical protein
MGFLLQALSVLGVTPQEGVTLVDESAKTLERGGLYVVVVVLLIGLIAIFVIKERQLQKHDDEKKQQIEDKDKQVKELHALVIGMVEKQTIVLTEANLNSRKIESHLERLMSHLERLTRP